MVHLDTWENFEFFNASSGDSSCSYPLTLILIISLSVFCRAKIHAHTQKRDLKGRHKKREMYFADFT